MKKDGILNSEISSVLSYMGHTDCICIADCGLPIPKETKRIDLALKIGQPSFIDTLKEMVNNLKVEKIILAEEIKVHNENILEEIKNIFKDVETDFKIEFIAHNQFKELTKNCKAVIRTGEATPYANIILQSSCIF